MHPPADHLPNAWGEGTLFAFSGVDGPTNAASGMVATLGSTPWSLLLHTPARRVFDLGVAPSMSSTPVVATGDVITADGVAVTWSAWHTLVGRLPADATPALRDEQAGPVTSTTRGTAILHLAEHEKDTLALAVRPDADELRVALGFGDSPEQATGRATAGLNADTDALIPQRLAFFNQLPPLDTPADARLAAKLASVMKVNTLGPEGPFTTRWSTPDRVPHRDLWLWDSAFHSLGMNHLDPDLAWEFLAAALASAQPDGRIPHQTAPTGWRSDITQPPVLAWAMWENFQRTQRIDRVAQALPPLLAYLRWDTEHRDRNGNGLLEWAPTDQHPGCESGLDNSPRFDRGPVDAVDFTALLVHDLRYVAKLAAADQPETAAQARALADDAAAALHDRLWLDDLGTYTDRDASTGDPSPTRAVSDFFPLLLDDLPAGRAERMAAWLDDPAHFATADPVPSVSVADPAFGTDMWRGASWVNTNYLLALGLRRQGLPDRAARLEADTARMVRDGVDRFGVTFEFYDAHGVTPPTDLDRKGPTVKPYNIRRKMDSIRDYHWTAALTLDLLLPRQQ